MTKIATVKEISSATNVVLGIKFQDVKDRQILAPNRIFVYVVGFYFSAYFLHRFWEASGTNLIEC